MDDIFMKCHMKLMELNRRIMRKLKQNLNEMGFAWNQYNVMKNIHPGESITLSELSEKVSKKNSNVTSIVDFLEERGIIRRCPDDRDRRVIRVELTEEGEKIREQVIKHHEEYVQSLYHSLDEDEVHDFLKVVEVFLNKIK